MLKDKRILILAPHTDDGELGCGATIARAIREGAQVFYVAFSIAEESVPNGFPKNQLETEVKEATKRLGIPAENLYIYKHEVRKFNYIRQEILEGLVKLRAEIQPDIVFLPSQNDVHQDHQTITQEGIRTFKNSTILGYELVWNNTAFPTDCFIHIEEEDLMTKIDALKAYKTQSGRNYFDPEFIKSLARVRGTQVGSSYAEAFEVVRMNVK